MISEGGGWGLPLIFPLCLLVPQSFQQTTSETARGAGLNRRVPRRNKKKNEEREKREEKQRRGEVCRTGWGGQASSPDWGGGGLVHRLLRTQRRFDLQLQEQKDETVAGHSVAKVFPRLLQRSAFPPENGSGRLLLRRSSDKTASQQAAGLGPSANTSQEKLHFLPS